MTANGQARFGPHFPEGIYQIGKQDRGVYLDPLGVSSLVQPLETSQSNGSFHTYRQRFMAGNEEEYEATERAYQEIYGSPSNHHLLGIRQCRKFAKFAWSADSGDVKVMSSACRDRWCPMCAKEKAHFAKDQALHYVSSLKVPRFLTLTLRNDPGSLSDQIEFLQDSFRRLRCRAFWKKKVTGGIWFLQVKRGHNSGCWHPHLHILLDGDYLEQGRLSALWELVTYGSMVVDIRKIYNPETAAMYVSRYVARPAQLSDLAFDDRREVIEALHGKRLCGTFGTAKCVTLTPPKIEDGEEWQDIGYYDEIAKKAETDPDCKAVVIAYHTKTPLSEEVFRSFCPKLESFSSGYTGDYRPVQMLLDFYNTE